MSRDEISDESMDRGRTAEEPSATTSDNGDPPEGEQGGVGMDVGDRINHRLYGAERLTQAVETPIQGLFTMGELRYLKHAHRMKHTHQEIINSLLEDRVEQFTESEWPLIEEEYPGYAERIREVVCEK